MEVSNKIYDILKKLRDDTTNEENDPLLAFAEVKQIEKIVKAAKDEIEPFAMNELDRIGEKTHIAHGFSFTKVNGRRIFDYKNCPSWTRVEQEKKAIESELKANFAYMERHGAISANSDTGEIGEIPQLKPSKDSITVKQQR